MYKAEIDQLFNIISRISDDTNLNQDDVFEDLSEFQLRIDEKLIPSIEKVQYENKYELMDQLKKVGVDIAFYLHFRSLIGRTVYAVDSVSSNMKKSIYNEFLQNVFADEIKRNTLWNKLFGNDNKMVISDSVPIILADANEGTVIQALNTADNDIFISNKQYIDLLNYSSNEKLDLASLVYGFSIPCCKNPEMAILLMPSQMPVNKYNNAFGSSVDILIIQGKNCTKEKLEYYKNIKEIYVIGKIPASEKEYVQNYANEKNIVLHMNEKLSKMFDQYETKKYGNSFNFCNMTVVSNLLFENSWYLSTRRDEILNSLETVNNDIMFKSEENEAFLKSLQEKYKKELSENENIYIEYKKNCDELIEVLFRIQDKVGVKELAEQDGELAINHHYRMETILLDYIIKMVITYKVFPQNGSKEYLRKYTEICERISGWDFVSEIFEKIFEEQQGISHEMVKNFLVLGSNSSFVNHFLVRYSDELAIEMESLYQIVTKINGKCSAKEKMILGAYEFSIENLEKAKKYLMESALLGNEAAGYMLCQYFQLTEDECKKLAENGDSNMAYKYGKKYLFDTDEETQRLGLRYLHIAAFKKSISASKLLGDYWYDLYDEEDTEDYAKQAKYYYKYAESLGCDDKKMFEKIGLLSYDMEQYKDAVLYFENAGTGEAFFMLGQMYEDGDGCAANETMALENYEKAIELGHSEASVSYERLNAKIESRKQKNLVGFGDYSSYYSSYSYYSGGYYSSYSSGW